MKSFRLQYLMILAALFSGGCWFSRAEVMKVSEYAPELSTQVQEISRLQSGSVINLSGVGKNFLIRRNNGELVSDESRRWFIPPEQMLKNAMYVRFTGGSSAPRVNAAVLKFEFDENCHQLHAAVRFQYQCGNGRENTLIISGSSPVKDGNYGKCAGVLIGKMLDGFYKQPERSVSR